MVGLQRMRCVVILFVLAMSGCYFSGREGYICKSSKECDRGLTCRTFSRGSDTRSVCVPPGTSSIGSKSTYTEFGVYAAWFMTFAVPLGLVALIVKERLDKKRAAK